MSEVDFAIMSFLLLMAVLGLFQGFVVGAFSLGGLLAGAFVATKVAQRVLGGAEASPYTPVVGLMGALAAAAVAGMVMQNVGVALRRQIRMPAGQAVDRLLGGVLAAVVALGVTWIVAAVLISLPQLRALRPFVVQSEVVARINRLLPPSGPVLNTLARYDPFPAFDGPRIAIAPPDEDVPRDPEIRAAGRSVVRVVGPACGFSVTGSGWVVEPGLVVTNAHVVAGVRDVGVYPRGGEGAREARVVAFDEIQDIALLRVDGLRVPPIRMAQEDPAAGTAGAVLGFPENGGFTSRAARFSDTRTVSSDDIYGQGRHRRSVTSFRGEVRHGNSGGPMVDGSGRVLTTVFASTLGSARGGYGVPNDEVRELVVGAGSGEVSTGSCTR